jgi:hypothetical protein
MIEGSLTRKPGHRPIEFGGNISASPRLAAHRGVKDRYDLNFTLAFLNLTVWSLKRKDVL